MATTITITPNNTTLNATAQTTTLTISSAIGGDVSDAAGITFTNPVGTLANTTDVEGALNFLANQFYVATSAPTTNTQDLAEGYLFYDTDDNQLKVYRDVNGSATFVPIMIGNDSADSDTIDAGAF